jgi:gluconate 2-dehydrogenase gamma chain
VTIDRRDALKAMALAPLAAALSFSDTEVAAASAHLETTADGDAPPPEFFNAREWRIVRVLADDVIPRDARSGSATDARVPEYMDFLLNVGSENAKTAMRNGLAWIDTEARTRFEKGYADCTPAQRHAILDDIAWPAKATPAFAAAATWFNSFRDMTASGFFTSRLGNRDLGYTGGVAIPRWTGSPPAVLRHLGVSYDQWDAKYGRPQ